MTISLNLPVIEVVVSAYVVDEGAVVDSCHEVDEICLVVVVSIGVGDDESDLFLELKVQILSSNQEN